MKRVKENIVCILKELEKGSLAIDENEVDRFVEVIMQAKHLFFAGTGRSGLVLRAFANRLLHLGFKVSFIGEISSPHSQPGDVVVFNSGSGETTSLISIAQKAKSQGLTVLLSTVNKNSTLYKLSDVAIVLPGQKKDSTENLSVQPMSSGFEQLSFILFDAIVLRLMELLGEDNSSMYNRHCDLE